MNYMTPPQVQIEGPTQEALKKLILNSTVTSENGGQKSKMNKHELNSTLNTNSPGMSKRKVNINIMVENKGDKVKDNKSMFNATLTNSTELHSAKMKEIAVNHTVKNSPVIKKKEAIVTGPHRTTKNSPVIPM